MTRADESHPYRMVACVVCAASGMACQECAEVVCSEHAAADAHDCAAHRRAPIPDHVLARAVAAWGYVPAEEVAREEREARTWRWNAIHSAVTGIVVMLLVGYSCYAGCKALADKPADSAGGESAP